jgi:hypothetical protein
MRQAIWVSHSTQIPCAGFYDSIKDGVKEAHKEIARKAPGFSHTRGEPGVTASGYRGSTRRLRTALAGRGRRHGMTALAHGRQSEAG